MSYLKRDCFDITNTTPGASENGHSSWVFLPTMLISFIVVLVCCYVCCTCCTDISNCFESCIEFGIKTYRKCFSKQQGIVNDDKSSDMSNDDINKSLVEHFANQDTIADEEDTGLLLTNEAIYEALKNHLESEDLPDSEVIDHLSGRLLEQEIMTDDNKSNDSSVYAELRDSSGLESVIGDELIDKSIQENTNGGEVVLQSLVGHCQLALTEETLLNSGEVSLCDSMEG